MSEIKVNSIKGVGASAAAITVNNTDGTCTANITNRSNRNLIINGAMQVAQRGASSTTNGYGSVDRYAVYSQGTDEAPTHAQVDVASGTTPYTSGFRKAIKVTNGNQTSGAGAGDLVAIDYTIEAQDIANSGWNYLSTSSYVTLSFWVKSSVAQNFYVMIRSEDSTKYNYPIETGSLTADTWTKITKTIPGNANLTFNNDNGAGLLLEFVAFRGTNGTGSVTLNQWAAYNSADRVPNMTSTWYTTNDATFEITGVQLEVGSVATDFEHRSFAQELQICKRYYNRFTAGTAYSLFADGQCTGSGEAIFRFQYPVRMRSAPTFASAGNIALWTVDTVKTITNGTITIGSASVDTCQLAAYSSGLTAGNVVMLMANNATTAYIEFIAEL